MQTKVHSLFLLHVLRIYEKEEKRLHLIRILT